MEIQGLAGSERDTGQNLVLQKCHGKYALIINETVLTQKCDKIRYNNTIT